MSESPEYRAEFKASISERGLLVPHDSGRWLGWLMRHAGKAVTVSISRAKRTRSLAQNSRYWSMVIPCFSEWSGYESEESHEVLLQMFSSYEDRLPGGAVVTRILRSRKMTVEQFNEFTAKVERFLVGHGFVFPEDRE